AAAAGLPRILLRESVYGVEGLSDRPRHRHLARRDGPELSAELGEHLVDQPGGEPHDDRYAGPPVPPDATALDRLPRHEGHERFHLPDPKRRDRSAVPVDRWPNPLDHGRRDAGLDD